MNDSKSGEPDPKGIVEKLVDTGEYFKQKLLKMKSEEAEKGTETEKETSLFSKKIVACPIEKCVMDPQVFDEIAGFLQTRVEFGGFLIGEYVDDKTANAYAAIFPPQTEHSATYCEFDSSYMVPTRTFLEESGYGNYGPVSWIHSHPGLGFFLSGTDQKTLNLLLKQNPKLLAMVVDPFTEEKAVVFANKSAAFETSKIAFERSSLPVSEEISFVLNILKTKLPTSSVITYRHKYGSLMESVSNLARRNEELKEEFGKIAQQVNYFVTMGIRRIDNLESVVQLRQCPKCRITFSSRHIFCPRCGARLVSKPI